MRANINGNLVIIPNFLTLEQTRMTLVYGSQAFNTRFSTTAVLAGTTFPASISKGTSVYRLIGKLESLSVESLLKGLGTLKNTLHSLGLRKFRIEHPHLDMTWNEKESTMLFFGYTSLPSLERSCVKLILFNTTNVARAGFFLNFQVQHTPLAAVVKALTGINVKGFPRLGQETLPNVMINVASKTVALGAIAKLQTNITSVWNNMDAKQGTFINFEQPLSDGTAVPMSLGVSEKVVDGLLPNGLPLDKTLLFFSPGAIHSSTYTFFHSHFTAISLAEVREVRYSISEGKLLIQGRMPVKLHLFNGKFQLRDVFVEVTLQKDHDLGMKLGGNMQLFGLAFTADVEYHSEKNKLIVKLQAKGNLKLIDLLTSMSDKIAKNKFVKVLQLDRFELIRPDVELIRAKEDYVFL